jgi:hypothetical protein
LIDMGVYPSSKIYLSESCNFDTSSRRSHGERWHGTNHWFWGLLGSVYVRVRSWAMPTATKSSDTMLKHETKRSKHGQLRWASVGYVQNVTEERGAVWCGAVEDAEHWCHTSFTQV